jgi:transcriptional regulator with XRE-family HTH domain
MDIATAFGMALRAERKRKGLTQEQLALEADLRRTFISSVELGEKQPSITTVFKLSKALGIKPSKLIDETEQECIKTQV